MIVSSEMRECGEKTLLYHVAGFVCIDYLASQKPANHFPKPPRHFAAGCLFSIRCQSRKITVRVINKDQGSSMVDGQRARHGFVELYGLIGTQDAPHREDVLKCVLL